MKFRVLAAVFGMVVATAPALAAQEQIYCELQLGPSIQGGWVAPDLNVLVEGDTDVTVFDGLISRFNKDKPLKAKVSANTEVKLKFSWSIFTISDSGQRTKMDYRAVIFRKTKEIQLTAFPVGYSNNFTGVGKCSFK